MVSPELQGRKERLKFERKQMNKLKKKKEIDDGKNWKLGYFSEECR